MTSQSFVIELPIAVDDAEMRTIVRKLEFARQLHNATLGTGAIAADAAGYRLETGLRHAQRQREDSSLSCPGPQIRAD